MCRDSTVDDSVLRLWAGEVTAMIKYLAWESGISLIHSFKNVSEGHTVTHAMSI